jgi:hypothetical protein
MEDDVMHPWPLDRMLPTEQWFVAYNDHLKILLNAYNLPADTKLMCSAEFLDEFKHQEQILGRLAPC